MDEWCTCPRVLEPLRSGVAFAGGAVFGGLAAVRRARSLHPDGFAFAATHRGTAGGASGVARHLLRFAGGFDARPYSSVLPYRFAGEPGVLGAVVHDDPAPGTRITVRTATPAGGWRDVGEVVLGEPLSARASERLCFNPSNAGRGIEPVGLPNRVRRTAYRASQAARPIPD